VSTRVVAVVVTWNRAPQLDRVLRALDAQTRRPDAVVVVDNASTDGTPALLDRLGAELAVPLTVRRLASNTGGAGGFADGIRTALGLDAELLWLMDDDGVPPPECLADLLPHTDRYDFLGPAVVAEHDEDRLCFPIRLPGRARVVHALSDLRAAATGGVLDGVVIPFNGVLVTRDLVERIGLPREEFFIWGDDVEYLWRARRAGARVATVVGSRFGHPATDDLGTPMAFGCTTYNHSPSDLKHYCMVRNNVTNLREYVGLLGVVAFLLKTVWFYALTRPQPARLRLSGEAVLAAVRRDFTGHRRFLVRPVAEDTAGPSGPEAVAVVVVTHNRADLLGRCLDGLAVSTRRPDAVYVVDNASTDHTRELLAGRDDDLPLRVLRSEANLGGAGVFHLGVRSAYEAGFDRIWLMDDDVVPAATCLEVLMGHPGPALIAVREDLHGRLCEKAATDFDLRNPVAVRPKRATVESTYRTRAAMPAEVVVENVAFEGFLVHRRVVAAVGLPDPGFFIFYDDADFAVRARRAGFTIRALRDAVLVRQLEFDQQHDTGSWKGYFMYRNLFVVHLRYGENPLVRGKPWALALAVLLTAGVRGRRSEARNVWRAVRDAPALARSAPPPAPGDPASRPS
jgi:GT2 family glycosyltransferase